MSRRTCDGLGIVVSKHVALDDPVVLEGDDLLPEFAAKMIQEYRSAVRAVFLHEDEIAVLRASMLARDRGIRRRHQSTQLAMVELARADGDRLRQAAERHDYPIVASRPRNTLSNRILSVLA
jgi:2-phosphoglycerate kinase